MLINIKPDILDVPIVGLKTKQKVKILFDVFKLPSVDYTMGYLAKPRPQSKTRRYNQKIKGNDLNQSLCPIRLCFLLQIPYPFHLP